MLAACSASSLAAQTTPTDTAQRRVTQPPRAPLDLSGVLYANYQYDTHDAPNCPEAATCRHQNAFQLERVYLTVRATVGERASIRVTSDVFQQTDPAAYSFYRGWVLRMKYAYLQYDFLRGPRSSAEPTAIARLGMLHTVVIEHIERFWPRWLGVTAVERAGFFSSADLGVAMLAALPRGFGELYATITNGPGYTSGETDRFKDFALRASITPWSARTDLMKTLTLSAWAYKGSVASRFVAGGVDQRGPVSSGLHRDRWGVFAGVRDRRVTLGAGYAERTDESEIGANTELSARVVQSTTGRLTDAMTLVRPLELLNQRRRSPVVLVARWDRFRPVRELAGRTDFRVLGLIWETTPRTSLSLDYQELLPRAGSAATPRKTYYLHLFASF